MPESAENLAAWRAVLDRFEQALDAADERLTVDDFEPPAGPPPAELVERARAVLARQQFVIQGLTLSKAKVARELAALRRVPAPASDTPAYLDVEG